MNGSSGILDERDTGTSEKEKTPESSQLSLTLEPEYGQDQEEEEDRLLGEVFSLSPRASSPHRDLVTRQEFLNSVLVIKGVTTFLSQMQNVTDKESLLNLDIMIPTNEEEHIVYVLLSYISQSLFTTENDDFRWIEEAVKSILEISNETFRHTFIEDSREICREFLDNVLLPELVTEKGVAVTRVVRAFSSNQVFGSVIVNFLLQKLLEIGDLLREAERYKLDHLPILETFHHHNRMILEIWPSYAQAICDLTSVAGTGKRKERSVKPRLSLSDTGGLVEELSRWQELLSEATRELSVIQPQFFIAVNNISKLISGAIQNITKQRV